MGTRVCFTLMPEGVVEEEYTSGVQTHSEMVYYDEIWDTYHRQTFPLRTFLVLSAVSVAFAAAALLVALDYATMAVAGGAMTAAWLLLLWRASLLSVWAYGYEGEELFSLHGLPGKDFSSFIAELQRRVEQKRYPLQSVFEALDLGHCEWTGRARRWRCSFVYDRLVLEWKGIAGQARREYYSLMALESPIRLVWRVPWVSLGGAAASGLLVLGLLVEGVAGRDPTLWHALLALTGANLAFVLFAVARLAIAVQLPVQGTPIRTPFMPWWQRAQLQSILQWFARLVHLADRLEELSTEDYWEFHRSKLGILKEEGFLEDWPYRSALARLNSQEREELGE
ncbi:MAG: hypothetical protein WBS54_00665 [Acidobacteriota bacterium]